MERAATALRQLTYADANVVMIGVAQTSRPVIVVYVRKTTGPGMQALRQDGWQGFPVLVKACGFPRPAED